MSDLPVGPGWWQASDGKWYPPQPAPPVASGPPGGAPSGGRPPSKSRTPLILAGAGAVIALIVAAVVMFSGGDAKKEAVTAGGGSTAATTSSAATSSPAAGSAASTRPSLWTSTASSSTPRSSSSSSSERTATTAAADGDVQVLEKGFATAREDYDPTQQAVVGAAVIVNSGSVATGRVEGTFTFLGADGTPLTTETDFITFLDPGEKAYLDVDTQLPVDDSVAALAVTLDVDMEPYRDITPHAFPVSQVHLERTSSEYVEAVGSVANDLTVTVNEVRIDCVFRNAEGALLVGDTTFSDEMAPGDKVAFEALVSADLLPTAATAECRAAWSAITEVGP